MFIFIVKTEPAPPFEFSGHATDKRQSYCNYWNADIFIWPQCIYLYILRNVCLVSWNVQSVVLVEVLNDPSHWFLRKFVPDLLQQCSSKLARSWHYTTSVIQWSLF